MPAAENLKFLPATHAVTGEAIVDVWDVKEAILLGTLYPTPRGAKFISKFITNHPLLVVIDPDDPPAVIISLERLPEPG